MGRRRRKCILSLCLILLEYVFLTFSLGSFSFHFIILDPKGKKTNFELTSVIVVFRKVFGVTFAIESMRVAMQHGRLPLIERRPHGSHATSLRFIKIYYETW